MSLIKSPHACKAPTGWPSCRTRLSSWHSPPCIVHFGSYWISFSSSNIPCTLFWTFSYAIFFFSCLEYFLFSLPLANSCFFFGSNIKNTSFWMLSWMFQAKVPLSGLSVPSEQEPSSITITWVFASPLDCHFCEDWSMSSFKCYLQCLAVIDVQQVLSIYLLNEWMSLNINHEPAFFMTQVQICNFFLASPVSLTGTTIPFPQSKQNFIDDKATYISQRKKNFPKGLRISIW